MRNILIAVISVSLLMSLSAADVSAAEVQSGLEMSPAYSDITLTEPGESQKLEITVTNRSPEPVALQMYPIDFKQLDASGTVGFIGQDAGSYSYSLASFLSLESDRMSLEPGESRVFAVTIQNRDDLSPGGHYAAVVGRLVQDGETEGTAVSPAISSLILLRKTGGERFNLSLKEVDWPSGGLVMRYPAQISLTFQNEGNIHVIPYGRIDIRDIFGRLVYKGIINTGSLAVLPESRRYIRVDMDPVEASLPISIGTMTVSGKDSLGKVTFISRETFVYVEPLFICLIVGFIILIVIIRGRIIKRVRK